MTPAIEAYDKWKKNTLNLYILLNVLTSLCNHKILHKCIYDVFIESNNFRFK